MADKKISELDAITGSNTAATDVFVVVDTSTGQTKKITREELNNAIEQDVLSSIDIDTINGDFSVNGNINLGDDNKAIFGAGSDLQIYHTGSDSVIADSGTGNLNILGDADVAIINAASTEYKARFITDGAVELYHNGSEKLATTSTGIDVTGTVTATSISVGDSHTIGNDGFDNLEITSSTSENIVLKPAGSVYLYNAGAVKLTTTSTGIDVTGKVSSDGLEVDLTSSGDVELTGAVNSNAGLVVRDPTASAYGAHFSYDDANTVVSIGGKTNGTKNTAITIHRDSNNISFYEDTGTTAKLEWLASDEDLKFADNSAAIFGAGSDLQIFHQSSNGNSIIKEQGGGILSLQTNGSEISFYDTANAANMARFITGGGVTLYHNGSNRFYTSAGGVNVNGALTVSGDLTVNGTTTTINSTTLEVDDKNIVLASGAADAAAANGSGITIDGASATFTYVSSGDKWQLNKPLDVGGDVTFGDSEKAIFGAGSDLQIYHDGSNSYIRDIGTGNLSILADELKIMNAAGTENKAFFVSDAGSYLYHNNSAKLETTSTGIDVTGNVNLDDAGKAIFGAGTDLQIYHDGSNSAIQNSTGELFVYGGGDEIRIRAENGEESIVAHPNGSVDLYQNGTQRFTTTNQGIDVTGLIATDGIISSDLITTTATNINTANNTKFRQYSFNATSGGGAWLLGKIEHNDGSDGAVDGKVYFGYDYGSTNDSAVIHFSFHQRNGAARGTWWYEHDDDDATADNVKVILVDDGSGNMYVWVVAADYTYTAVEAVWRNCSQVTDSGNLSSGTVTSGTTLFDTSNDPTSEMHIGRLFAHDDVSIGGDVQLGGGTDISMSSTSDGQFRIDGDGYSGAIALNANGMHIYHNSSVRYMSFGINETEEMRLETDGDLHVDGNVVAYSTTISDIRLKKDIAPIEDAVTKVQQLNGCTFTYLKDDRKSAGLIAQDVEKVLPSAVIEDEAVFHGEEGETYKTVQYDQVIGLLVEAVKELKAEIEELKNGTAK